LIENLEHPWQFINRIKPSLYHPFSCSLMQ